MSFIDCIRKHIEEKKLSPSEVKRLEDKYNGLVESYKKTMGDQAAAGQAALNIITKESERIIKLKENRVRNALIQDGLLKKLNAKGGNFGTAVAKEIEEIDGKASRIVNQIFHNMNELNDQFSPKMAGLKQDVDGFLPVVRSVMGEASDNPTVQGYAHAVSGAYETMGKRLQAAGAILTIEKNHFPVTWEPERIRETENFEEWWPQVKDHIDLTKMIDDETGLPFNMDEKFININRDNYLNIKTEGRHGLAKALEEGKRSYGKKSLAARRDYSRFYYFKNADSFIEVNRKWGVGDAGLYNSVINTIEAGAKDIAMMETFGPNAGDTMSLLEAHMEAKNVGGVREGIAKGAFAIQSGLSDPYKPNKFIMGLRSFKNLTRSAISGMISLSTTSDLSYAWKASMLHGIKPTEVMKAHWGQLNPLDDTDRKFAKAGGHSSDYFFGKSLADQRFSGQAMGGGVTSWLSNMTNRVSGLQFLTTGLKQSLNLGFESTMAIYRHTEWENLNRFYREAAEAFDITKEEWDMARKTIPSLNDQGVEFLSPNDIIKSGGGKNIAENAKLSEKFAVWQHAFMKEGSTEPTARTKAITTGAALGIGRKSVAMRELISSAFFFKAFPVAVMMHTTLPMYHALRRGDMSRASIHAVAIATATLGGALTLQLGNIALGKDPEDMTEGKFWLRATVLGGGFSLIGDAIVDSAGGKDKLLEFAAGPVFGKIADIIAAGASVANGDELDAYLKKAFKLIKGMTPLQNLWYTRLLTDRIGMDAIERLIDPDYEKGVRRQERSMRKKNGQEFWFGRGESSPERAPKFDAMMGE